MYSGGRKNDLFLNVLKCEDQVGVVVYLVLLLLDIWLKSYIFLYIW